ncbi:MAG: hypothetical protein SPLM_09820 [Spiroplasma phoeniceum]|uniref:hypothetical protein n=1 Tax=Spiroplasma phoeniceum TaxID=47835 RepID=UPI003134002A
MALKNVKYVLINENNEPIKNEDGSLAIQNAEFVFANQEELDAHNAELIKLKSEQEQRISELVTLSEKQAEELKRIDIWNFIDSLTSDEDFKNVLLKSYDITDDIEIIKTQLQSVYDELIKLQTVNTGGVPKVENKENNILDTDNVFNK